MQLDDSSSHYDNLVKDLDQTVHLNDNPFEVHNHSNTHDNYSKNNQIAYSTTDIAEIELLKLLNNTNVPHFLYCQILEWGHKSYLNGYNFEPINKKTMIPQNLTSITFNIHTSPKRGQTKKHQFASRKP